MQLLYQVTAPHFCAGIVVDEYKCLEAAPILGWAVGRQRSYLRRYFKRKGWIVRYVGVVS